MMEPHLVTSPLPKGALCVCAHTGYPRRAYARMQPGGSSVCVAPVLCE